MGVLQDRILDRLNPILVKEVRQAVAARYFKVSFGFTLGAATGLAAVLLASMGEDAGSGRYFFSAMFACLGVALFFWVPFFAFLSMGAEYEENTLDLLVLSDLRPRRIVYGKLWSAVVQTLLYFSAFGPFLVFAFLLQGIDLVALLCVLAGALGYSVSLSLLAIGLSSLTRVRILRRALMSLAALALLGATITGIVSAANLLFSMGLASRKEMVYFLSAMLSMILAVALLWGEIACTRLAHPEENRSSGLRALVAATFLVYLGWVFATCQTWGYSEEMVTAAGIAAAFLWIVPAIFFASEPETLGRRVRLHVARHPLLALLALPFLPGGGRGFLLALLGQVGLLVGVGFIHWYFRGGSGGPIEGVLAWMAAPLYAIVYLGLPTGLFAHKTRLLQWRIAVRLAVPILVLLSMLVPTLALFFAGAGETDSFRHPGWVVWVLDQLWDRKLRWWGPLFLGLILAVGLVVMLNLPRMALGVREVLLASEERRRSQPSRSALPASGLADDAGAQA